MAASPASGTQINLSWTASTDDVGVTGYKVERCQGGGCSNFAQIATPTGTTFNDTGLTSATSYSYRVRATDAAGNLSNFSNVATTATPDTIAPTAPSNLTANAASATQINLSWTASTDNVGVTGYKVERCQGGGCSNFAQIAAPSAAAFTDSGLTNATSYSYRVRATDAAGNLSGFSNTATTVTPDTTPPSAPTSLTATAASSGTQINLSWTASTDNVGVTSYKVERCSGAGCSNFAQIASPTATSFNDTGLTPSTSYSYRVRATDVAGNLSNYSNVATASTQTSSITVSLAPMRAAVTTAQTQTYIATVTGSGNTNVTWDVDSIAGGNATVGRIDLSGKYTPPLTGGTHAITATSQADVTKSASASVAVTDLTGVFTYHNDDSRTGQNVKEFALTPATVNTSMFGKLFSCTVDAAVYAQPLWVANLSIGGATHNVVFVATQRNTVYAIDADANPCVTYWKTGANGVNSLVPPGETWVTSADESGCSDLVPDIGITGTPVIDSATSTLYVVTKTKDTAGTLFHQRLHALDLLTGGEKFTGPKDIQATVSGTGGGSSGGSLSFDAMVNGQRPALLLSSDGTGKHVLISWASHCDFGQYHGWVISYGAGTLAKEAVFNVSPNGTLGGIWMAGNGPAADSSGNIFFATGNGNWTGTDAYGDSIVKLGPQSGGAFGAIDYFTPANQLDLENVDEDLGSGGLLLLPDLSSGAHPHLLVQAGKEGKIYLLDRQNMGHIFCTTSTVGNPCSPSDPQIVQELPAGTVGGMWDSPAYWNGNLFFGGAGDNLKAFSFNAGSSGVLSLVPTSQSGTGGFGFPGTTPSVSASTTTNGVVWTLDVSQYCTYASSGCNPAVLHAYDATNLATELWNSSQVVGDQAGLAVKFAVPTVANGKVYIGTRGNDTGAGTSSILGELDVYGLKPN